MLSTLTSPSTVGAAALVAGLLGFAAYRHWRRRSVEAQAVAALQSNRNDALTKKRRKIDLMIKRGGYGYALDEIEKLKPDDWTQARLEAIALHFEQKGKMAEAQRAHAMMTREVSSMRALDKVLPSADTVMEPPSQMMFEQSAAKAGSDLPDALAITDIQPDPSDALLAKRGKLMQLGKFRLLKLMSKSRFSVVYLARHMENNQPAVVHALPVVAGAEKTRDENLAQLQRVTRALAAVEEPGIARVLAIQTTGEVPFFVTEAVDGVPLSNHIAPTALMDPKNAAVIIVRVARTLRAAHRANLLHGDIRPDNIIFDRATKSVKLINFGIVQITQPVETAAGIIHGTPSYMAPEQISARKADNRSDLFALGVTAYQLFTGRLPFAGGSFNELVYSIATHKPKPPTTFNKKLPPALDGFFETALSKDPKTRFQSASEFNRALKQCFGVATNKEDAE